MRMLLLIDPEWSCAGKAGVDQELTVAAGEDGDISTSADEDAYVAAE
jgi:hypothetical protein